MSIAEQLTTIINTTNKLIDTVLNKDRLIDTKIQQLAEKADKIAQSDSVKSVNNKTGIVQINAKELGALFKNDRVYQDNVGRLVINSDNCGFQSRPHMQDVIFPFLEIVSSQEKESPAIITFHNAGRYASFFGLDTDGYFKHGGWSDGDLSYQFWTERNTTVDANGFIKKASPIVRLFNDGQCELNSESLGITTKRITEGTYLISGGLGFHADNCWHIEVPQDENKQPLVWVDYDVEASGDIKIKTYHRTHPDAPIFAQNNRQGYQNGDLIDIPHARWLDLRLNVAKEKEIIY